MITVASAVILASQVIGSLSGFYLQLKAYIQGIRRLWIEIERDCHIATSWLFLCRWPCWLKSFDDVDSLFSDARVGLFSAPHMSRIKNIKWPKKGILKHFSHRTSCVYNRRIHFQSPWDFDASRPEVSGAGREKKKKQKEKQQKQWQQQFFFCFVWKKKTRHFTRPFWTRPRSITMTRIAYYMSSDGGFMLVNIAKFHLLLGKLAYFPRVWLKEHSYSDRFLDVYSLFLWPKCLPFDLTIFLP